MKAALSAAGGLAFSGGGAVTTLTLADAPWVVIAAVIIIAIFCRTLVHLVQAVLPQDSSDRLKFGASSGVAGQPGRTMSSP